ncbi:class I SAM-dependent methyltransferase [Actinomadura sp. DC4]|uniref:class I SAM-dependent methyltransferase n=1 Tax=Actinomadura sp. DC4 TaxID=3055069 RepID=UPI0025B0322E|nr:class I SAM-dependent methyltransferase [Actinomadura sp. DC4]MDN3359979.1 class I SAM-dependent methyltransferase [Actinomadura sp. DC4]
METEKVTFSEEKTLLDALYAKALDSQAAEPILGDAYAAEVVAKIDYDFGKIKVTPRNAGIVAIRARQFDAWVREFLAGHPNATVLHLGCGLDSRVNRIDPPTTVRWYDVDYPDVIEKRKHVCRPHPAASLIGTSVTELEWLESVPVEGPVLVIGEGLFMYLPEEDGKRLLRRLTERFPSGEMLFDMFSRSWLRLENHNPLIKAEGGVHWGIDDPGELERDLPLRCETVVSASVLPGVDRLRRPWGTVFRLIAAVPPLKRGFRLLRYRW